MTVFCCNYQIRLVLTMAQQEERLSSTKTSSIVKCGYLWKKGTGVFGNHYKERLFELKLTGKLDYYEQPDKQSKTWKGTISLSSSSIVKVRQDVPSDQHKFVIQTAKRIYFLWHRGKDGKEQVEEWCTLLNQMIQSSKANKKTTATATTDLVEQAEEEKDAISATPQEIVLGFFVLLAVASCLQERAICR